MILRPQPTFLELLYAVRGSVVRKLAPQILLIFVISLVVVTLHTFFPDYMPAVHEIPLAVLGTTLSIFMGFRNKACYDRWWEARQQWGKLITVTRQLSRRLSLLEHDKSPLVGDVRRALEINTIRFTHALTLHLRPDGTTSPSRPEFVDLSDPDIKASANRPDAILRQSARLLAALQHEKVLSDISFQTIDMSLEELGAVQAACERIQTTPLPFAYTLLLHRTAHIFCCLFPIGFAGILGWFTPVISVIIGYTFFGLDALGAELERPFGNDDHALPLAAMTRIVEIGVLESLGDPEIPSALQPEDFVLM